MPKIKVKNKSSDVILIEQAKNNDTLAMQQLLSRYQKKSISLIKRYVNTNADAQDISQEVLLKIYLSVATFNQSSSFNTWYYRIVMNTLSSHFRNANHKLFTMAVNYEDFENANFKFQNHDAPEGLLIAEQTINKMINTLSNLPQELINTLVLFDIEGYSYQDIAKKLNCPIGTIRSRIHRARMLVNSQ